MVCWIDNTALETEMGKKKDERKRREREARESAVRAQETETFTGAAHPSCDDNAEPREHAETSGRKHDRDHKHHDHKPGTSRDGDPLNADRRDAGRKHGGAVPFAGLAATFVKQLETPLGRQIIAAGLMAAAGAISRQDTKASARPAPPTPPPTPPSAPPQPETPSEPRDTSEDAPAPKAKTATGPFAGKTAEPPRSDAAALPPEMAKMIDSVAVGLGRLFTGFGKPTGEGSTKDTPPKG